MDAERDGELDPEHLAPLGEGRRFLLFGLAEVDLAIELSRLEEIVEPGPITRAPGAPSWVLGALNLRGQALPVIDLAGKLGLVASREDLRRPAILIFRSTRAAPRLGVWVSNVLGFVEVGEDAFSPAPRFDGAIPSDLLEGLVALGDGFVPVLDLSKAVSGAGGAAGAGAAAGPAAAANPAAAE